MIAAFKVLMCWLALFSVPSWAETASPRVFHYQHRSEPRDYETFQKYARDYNAQITGFYRSSDLVHDRGDKERLSLTYRFRRVLKDLDESDTLIVNITPYDGVNADANAGWLLGYALAKGKRILVYTKSRDKFETRIRKAFAARGLMDFTWKAGRIFDPDEYSFDNFETWDNLMVDGCAYQSFAPISHELESLLAQHLRAHSDLRWDFTTRPPLPERKNKLYLAGPDVFLKDYVKASEAKKQIAKDYGFEALWPMDNEIPLDTTPKKFAMKVFKSDVQMMLRSGVVVANMTPFRGHDMDQGTAVEMGFMFAKGDVVLGYNPYHEHNRHLALLPVASVTAQGFTIASSFSRALSQIADPNHKIDSSLLEEKEVILHLSALVH